jgi:hypothetical protein
MAPVRKEGKKNGGTTIEKPKRRNLNTATQELGEKPERTMNQTARDKENEA